MKNTQCQRKSADVHTSGSSTACAALDREQWTQTVDIRRVKCLFLEFSLDRFHFFLVNGNEFKMKVKIELLII